MYFVQIIWTYNVMKNMLFKYFCVSENVSATNDLSRQNKKFTGDRAIFGY
jgi:hypothetical protein